jgi:hypothetical protein
MSALEQLETKVTYLDFNADELYSFHRRGLCCNCGTEHRNQDCCSRYCDSCSRYWLADTPRDGDDGRTAKEDCPECVLEQLVTEAAAELTGLEWFEALPTNAAEDEAIFVRALEIKQRRELLEPLAEQMDTATDAILSDLNAKTDQAVEEVVASLDAPAPVKSEREAA